MEGPEKLSIPQSNIAEQNKEEKSGEEGYEPKILIIIHLFNKAF